MIVDKGMEESSNRVCHPERREGSPGRQSSLVKKGIKPIGIIANI